MNEISGIAGDHVLRLELIDITKKLAPEKLGAVLESLSPVGLSDLGKYQASKISVGVEKPRLKGKDLLEQALSIFK